MKILIFGLLAVFIFGRGIFPNEASYWICYGFSFILLILLWVTMFWVSRKRATKILGFKPDFDIFCGKVPYDVNDDLARGRLCVGNGKIYLIKKTNGKFNIEWQEDIDNVTAVSFKKVIGVRRGFVLRRGENEVSFACGRIKRHKSELFKAFGWNKEA